MDQQVEHGAPWARRDRLAVAAVVVVFALGVWLLFLPLGLADSSHLPGCACGDQVLQVWFLAADHYALAHSHLSLLSTRIDYPQGVNLMDNTSMILLGVVANPLFSVAGPVGVFVFLMRLGMFLSAVSSFFVLRRYTRSVFAAAVGGALYGFGPFLSHEGQVHVFLAFVPIPPIMFYLVQRRLFDGRRHVAIGVALGLLAVAQYFIASEVLVATVLLVAVTVGILGLWEMIRRRPVGPRVRPAIGAIGAAAGVGIVVLAYPAWFALKGPQHILGRTQQAVKGIDLVNVLRPSTRLLLADHLFRGFPASTGTGDMAYLGIPLLVILIAVIIVERRSRVVSFAAIFGLVAFLLALGPHLIIDGHMTKIPLPFDLLDRLPLLQDLIPSRFMLFVDLAAAVILAVGVDRLLSLSARPSGAPRPGKPRWAGPVAAIALSLVGLILVVPSTRFVVRSTQLAGPFLDGRMNRYIPTNGVVLTYPFPMATTDRGMTWQADTGLRYSLIGGYALRPVADPQQDKQPALLPPHPVIDALVRAWPTHLPGSGPTSLAQAEAALPTFVRRYHVTTILVDVAGKRPYRVIRLFRFVYGAPVRFEGLLIWDNLRARVGTTK